MIVALAAALAALAPANPPPPVTPLVRVGDVRSEKSCELVAANWAWLLIECNNQFPQLRTALQSALLDSKKVRLSTSHDSTPPDLIVSASVTGLDSSVQRASAADYCIATNRIEGRLDYRVRRSSGETVYGGSVVKSVEVASNDVAGSSSCYVKGNDPGAYRKLEGEIALTAARAIVFRIAPLRVTDSSEQGVALNYGVPFLRLGDAVDVAGERGIPARFRVTSTDAVSAFAVPDGHHRLVPASARATYIEQDDPANNARRFRKAELP